MRRPLAQTRVCRDAGRIICIASAAALLILSGSLLRAQEPDTTPQPPSELPTEPEIEPSPIPGTEILLAPQPISPEEPLPGRTLKLGPPAVVQPMLPPVDFARLGQSGRLWSFNGTVREFQITGNHVFSTGTLQRQINGYRNRAINADDIEQARQELTLFYINHGYVNSGVILPDQDGSDGIIRFQVVEGQLTSIRLKGNRWFRPWWLRNEIRRGAGRPLNFNKLKETLQLLRENPTISQINAELQPGGVPGESILDVTIKDTQPFRFALELNNKRPPSDGAEILNAHFTDLNLTGHNDVFDVVYGIANSKGASTFQDFDFSGLDNVGGSYTFPVTPWATTLEVHGSRSNTSILEQPFTTLDINSKLEQYGVTLRQPVYRTPANEIALSITAEKRRDETFLLGQRFSLSPGAVNGVTNDFVLRIAQEFVNRSQVHVLALRSTFNIGIDAFDATDSGMEPNSTFFYWLGQAQYVRRLFNTDTLLVARLNGQISANPLFSLEQFVLGGSDSVRGYRENTILRDNGIFASVEVRVPVWTGKEKNVLLAIAPFVDVGTGWNTLSESNTGNNTGNPAPPSDHATETLTSTGLGLIFTPYRRVQAVVYWGYGFNRDLIQQHHNLQDYGVHFALSASAF
jgi:hemolysin activation/secretion protein